jgi:spore maturation protein CgeB
MTDLEKQNEKLRRFAAAKASENMALVHERGQLLEAARRLLNEPHSPAAQKGLRAVILYYSHEGRSGPTAEQAQSMLSWGGEHGEP